MICSVINISRISFWQYSHFLILGSVLFFQICQSIYLVHLCVNWNKVLTLRNVWKFSVTASSFNLLICQFVSWGILLILPRELHPSQSMNHPSIHPSTQPVEPIWGGKSHLKSPNFLPTKELFRVVVQNCIYQTGNVFFQGLNLLLLAPSSTVKLTVI